MAVQRFTGADTISRLVPPMVSMEVKPAPNGLAPNGDDGVREVTAPEDRGAPDGASDKSASSALAVLGCPTGPPNGLTGEDSGVTLPCGSPGRPDRGTQDTSACTASA